MFDAALACHHMVFHIVKYLDVVHNLLFHFVSVINLSFDYY
jgi:hypothetical protein